MANKNHTLIKLDDKVIEITRDKKGLVAKELTDNELLEVSLLDEGVEKLIENDIARLTNEAYDEVKLSFKNNLKANTLKVAGFDDHWGKWEVDRCNGRSSVVTQYIGQKVQNMFTAEFDKMLQPEIEKALEPLKKTLVADFKREFEYHVKQQMRVQLDVAAKAFVSSVMTKQVAKHQKKALEKAELAFLGRKIEPDED